MFFVHTDNSLSIKSIIVDNLPPLFGNKIHSDNNMREPLTLYYELYQLAN